MAKKTTSRSKVEPNPDAPAAPEASPKPRSRARATKPQPEAAVAVVNDRATNMDDIQEASTSLSMASEPSEADIRVRAYLRYLERGGGHGTDFEDWVEAERELRQGRKV